MIRFGIADHEAVLQLPGAENGPVFILQYAAGNAVLTRFQNHFAAGAGRAAQPQITAEQRVLRHLSRKHGPEHRADLDQMRLGKIQFRAGQRAILRNRKHGAAGSAFTGQNAVGIAPFAAVQAVVEHKAVRIDIAQGPASAAVFAGEELEIGGVIQRVRVFLRLLRAVVTKSDGRGLLDRLGRVGGGGRLDPVRRVLRGGSSRHRFRVFRGLGAAVVQAREHEDRAGGDDHGERGCETGDGLPGKPAAGLVYFNHVFGGIGGVRVQLLRRVKFHGMIFISIQQISNPHFHSDTSFISFPRSFSRPRERMDRTVEAGMSSCRAISSPGWQ